MKKILVLIVILSMLFAACSTLPEKTSTMSPETQGVKTEVDESKWKSAYAELLLGSFMEMNAGAMYYENGLGRFSLKDMNGDSIPELFIIAEDDTSLVYTYNSESDEAVSVKFADGGTDVVYLEFGCLKFGNDGSFIEDCGTSFNYWVIPENKDYDYVVKFYACTYGEKYVCNEFEAERLCKEGFDYRMSFPDNEVSEDEYKKYIERYNYAEGEYSVQNEKDVYMITEKNINKVLN